MSINSQPIISGELPLSTIPATESLEPPAKKIRVSFQENIPPADTSSEIPKYVIYMAGHSFKLIHGDGVTPFYQASKDIAADFFLLDRNIQELEEEIESVTPTTFSSIASMLKQLSRSAMEHPERENFRRILSRLHDNLKRKIDEICSFYKKCGAWGDLQRFTEEVLSYKDNFEYRQLLADACLHGGNFSDALSWLSQALRAFNPSTDSYSSIVSAVQQYCNIALSLREYELLPRFFNRCKTQFSEQSDILTNLQLQFYEQIIQLVKMGKEKALTLLDEVDEIFFIYATANSALNRELQIARKTSSLSSQASFFFKYSYRTDRKQLVSGYQALQAFAKRWQFLELEEHIEKIAALERGLSQQAFPQPLPPDIKERQRKYLWQKSLLSEPPKMTLGQAFRVESLLALHDKLITYVDDFANLRNVPVFRVLLEQAIVAKQTMNALTEKILTTFESGDLCFSNDYKYSMMENKPPSLIERTTLLFSGPHSHVKLIEFSDGEFHASGVNGRYYLREAALDELLSYETLRINPSKLVTEEAKNFVATFFTHYGKKIGYSETQRQISEEFAFRLRNFYAASVEEVLAMSPGRKQEEQIEETMDVQSEKSKKFSNSEGLYIKKAVKQLDKRFEEKEQREHLHSLWNNMPFVRKKWFGGLIPYKFNFLNGASAPASASSVKLENGVMCSEFAIKIHIKALAQAEAKVKNFMKEIVAEYGELSEEITMEKIEALNVFNPLLPTYVDPDYITPENILTYGKPYLEIVEIPAVLKNLVQAPDAFWQST